MSKEDLKVAAKGALTAGLKAVGVCALWEIVCAICKHSH